MNQLMLLLLLLTTLTPALSDTIERLDEPKCTVQISLGVQAASLRLDSWGSDSIRVRYSPDPIIDPPIQALKPTPPKQSGDCSTTATDSSAITALSNGNLVVTANADVFTVVRSSDNLLIATIPIPAFTVFTPSPKFPSPYSLYSFEVNYSHALGHISGLGEHKIDSYEPYFTHLFQNSQLYSYSQGGDIMIPFYTSSAGFGLLFNHAGYGYVNISSTSATWYANASHQLDLWITTTPAKPQVPQVTPYPYLLSHYVDVIGHPQPIPTFATGFWQSKDRYRSQEDVLNVTSHFYSLSTPISVFVIDWLHWCYEGDWGFCPTTGCWPDPASMVKQIASYGYRTMISVWPTVDLHSTHWKAMNESGLLTMDADGKSLAGNPSENSNFVYDSFKKAARDFVWKALSVGYVQYGIKIFWLDNDEPDGSYPGKQYWDGRSDNEVGMAWSVKHQQMIYEGLASSGEPASEIIMLSRNAWVGTNDYNAVIWSGDTSSDWDTFAQQIKVAQQVAMSGIYWWTTDVAGYYGGEVADPSFQELLVRWFQFGVFSPIFRTHGHREPSFTDKCGRTGSPNEFFGFQYASLINQSIYLRESIRDYVELHLNIASVNGTPILRPMYYDFEDQICLTSNDQFMFGPKYLVAPVYIYQATNRSVYLPTLSKSENWVHYFTGQTYSGGQTVVVPTRLNDFPLFTRSPTNQYVAMN